MGRSPRIGWKSPWKSLWNRVSPRPALRSIVLFSSAREFVSSRDASQWSRSARAAEDRLTTVAEVFGRDVPVYAVFTKTDEVPYYREYFGRLPEGEAGQAFGFTIPFDRDGKPGLSNEADTRRLSCASPSGFTLRTIFFT